MTAGRNERSADRVCRGLAEGYRGGRIGDSSREWVDMVEGLKDNLCYYEA